MKNYRSLITVLALSALFSTGCKKFLERPVEGQLTKEEAFKDEQGLVNFTNGMYSLVGDGDFAGGRIMVLNELLGDHFKGDKFTGDFAEIYKRQNSFFGATRDGFYSKGYQIIARANVALENLSIAVTKKDSVEGQAKFFRALAHFELVKLMAQPFGYAADNSQAGIPLRTSISLASIDRASVKDVYDQIIADLKRADSILPAAPANGKFYMATKLAAEAYLAKVYFQMNNFAQAYRYADMVISSNKFQLDTSYNYRYSLGLSKEGVWVIPNQTGNYEVGGELRGNFSSIASIPQFVPADMFYATANTRATDKRRSWYSSTLQAGTNVLTKYNKLYFDLPVIHLTEIKLIRAESGAELGNASLATGLTDINDLLTRAYGSNAYNLPATASQSTVISTVRAERELEMVAEGNRVQEIKRIGARSGVNIDRRGSPWNCNGFTLQFPKAEQDANAAFKMNPTGGCF